MRDVVRELGYLCLGTRMRRIGEKLQAETQRVLDENCKGLTTANFPLLAALDQLGTLTVGELVQALDVRQPNVTRAAMQLEKQGLVSFGIIAGDQRKKTVSLTAQGEALINRSKDTLWPSVEAAASELCGDMPVSFLDLLSDIEAKLSETALSARINTHLAREDN